MVMQPASGFWLPATKAKIFNYITANPNCTRAQIANSVYSEGGKYQTVSVHITGINKALSPTPLKVIHTKTKPAKYCVIGWPSETTTKS